MPFLVALLMLGLAGGISGAPVPTATDKVIHADSLPGSDAGAKINAADSLLGSSTGTIVYNAATPQRASTNVRLSSHHHLALQSPIAWTASITLPTGSTGQDISCPALQTFTHGTASGWITGTGVSNVVIHDCKFAGVSVSGDLDLGVSFLASSNVSIVNNNAKNALLVAFASTAPSFKAVAASNSNSNLTIRGNFGLATRTNKGQFIKLVFTNGAVVSGNSASGYADSFMYWGGDSCLVGCSGVGEGALTNPRKTTNLTISNNTFTNVLNACIWGSMGQRVSITGNKCVGNDTTTDVGLDLEGTWDSVVSKNTVSGFRNGDLATFFYSTRVVFEGNIATQDLAGSPLISTHNSSNAPSGLIQTFEGNTLTCTAATSCGTHFESAEVFNIKGNHLANTTLTVNGLNTSQINIVGNDLVFTKAAPHAILATNFIAGESSTGGKALVEGNTITSSAPQAAGSSAIQIVGNDYNAVTTGTVRGNRIAGSHPFPIDITCSAGSRNGGVPTNCTLSANTLAMDAIVTANSASGARVMVSKSNNTRAK